MKDRKQILKRKRELRKQLDDSMALFNDKKNPVNALNGLSLMIKITQLPMQISELDWVLKKEKTDG